MRIFSPRIFFLQAQHNYQKQVNIDLPSPFFAPLMLAVEVLQPGACDLQSSPKMSIHPAPLCACTPKSIFVCCADTNNLIVVDVPWIRSPAFASRSFQEYFWQLKCSLTFLLGKSPDFDGRLSTYPRGLVDGNKFLWKVRLRDCTISTAWGTPNH